MTLALRTCPLGAVFSWDRRYRYLLQRMVGIQQFWAKPKGICTFVMLNPSTADETQDDPTIRRCIRFARDWQFEQLEVVNLFAFRATNPQALRQVDDPVGRDNNHHIWLSAHKADRIIVAWGSHGKLFDRGLRVLELLKSQRLYHWGLTESGQPRHPLYVRHDHKLERMAES